MAALEREIARLRERAGEFKSLCDRVEKATSSRPYLYELLYCIRRVAQAYETGLEKCILKINAAKRVSVAAAAKKSDNLQKATDLLLSVLGSAAQSMGKVPEELLELTIWSFERVGLSHCPFAIALDDKLAMLTLNQIAEQNGIKDGFDDFYSVFEEERVGNFAILLIPEAILSRTNSLNWSLIPHEVGHAFIEQSRIISKRYPHVPTEWLARRLRGHKGDLDALNVMHLTEYACDEIAVRLTGCAFPWRLFTDLFGIERMSTATTHPQINRRVRRAAQLAKELGFSKEADAIVGLLENELSEVDYGIIQEDVPADKLKDISDELRAAIPAVTASEMVEICKSHPSQLAIERVSASLKAGTPVALDAWVVLSAATPDLTIHTSPQLQEAIADSIRLGQVRNRFKAIAGDLSQ